MSTPHKADCRCPLCIADSLRINMEHAARLDAELPEATHLREVDRMKKLPFAHIHTREVRLERGKVVLHCAVCGRRLA